MGSYGMLAKRAVFTETPVMVQIQELLRGVKGAISLAQGVVYWQPPKLALEKVRELVWEPSISKYGADEGLPELWEALTKKLQDENKLCKSSVMVTAGANQAFVNIVLTLCDAGDSVVMFAPYYFNAYMSFQMTGVTNILVGPGDPNTLHPDAELGKLERTSQYDMLHIQNFQRAMGPKTLCNACGVRYKSGRLVTEYRPANSPTCSRALHSKSHQKIMEMRKKMQAI